MLKSSLPFLLVVCCLCGMPQLSAGSVVINEFLASNDTIAPDNRDFDDYSDWIELHNSGTGTISLTNHFLTDDLTRPFKWLIPSGALIPEGGYLMIRADGYDAGPGEEHSRGYYPWGSTFTTRRYHANFKLSAGGEDIGLYRTDGTISESTLIATNSVWKYYDLGTDPGADWMEPDYVDAAWEEGPAVLGYGKGSENTVVSYGSNSSEKYATTYFRHRFSILDADRIGNIRLRLLVDDGAVAYLNGEEIARIRIPEGDIAYQDYTGTYVTDASYELIEFSAEALLAGDNVLAVEVHQGGAGSYDLSFGAELKVSEIAGEPVLVDTITFGPQTTDVSYGRDSVSTNGWSFFGEPTPGGANSTEALMSLTKAPAVTASVDSGFLATNQAVYLIAAGADRIHYTTDGSIPSSASSLYTNAVEISETTILRARAFSNDQIPGPVLTRSYFMGLDAEVALPVVSLVADPATLFDDDFGIYENDTDYVFKGREVPARIEFFEADQRPGFAVGAGIRIGGENIWLKAQKPFNVYCRSKYGDDFINYQLFPDEPVGMFGELSLRNGGDDWEETLLRDAMMPSILVDQTRASLYSYRPSVLFLNGEFWGIYNIRKRFDDLYFGNEHYLSEGDYDQLAYAHNGAGDTVLMAESGSTKRYEAFKEFFTTNDLDDPAIYAAVLDQLDVDSFIDYVVAMDFVMNTSWSHNREFWKGRTDGAKWRWVINDFDRGWDESNLSSSLIDDFRSGYELFRALDDNTNFVNRLIQRYAAHVGSTYHSDRISDKLDLLVAEQDGAMERHIERWSSAGGISSLASRQAQLDEIKEYAEDRPAYAFSRLQRELGLSLDMWDLTATALPAEGGRIQVAGVPMAPGYATNITLFSGTPIELKAESAPGYRFVDWSNGETNETIDVTLSGAMTLSARFESGAETVLAGSLTGDTTLTAAASPYAVTGDLVVPAGTTLTVEAGARLRMPRHGGLRVYGTLMVNGTASDPVVFEARDGHAWGNLGFVDASGVSTLSHVVIRDATRGTHDPVNLLAAVSGYNSGIILDHVDIEAAAPVFTRFGSTEMRDSRIHILFTGDGINVKSGDGVVERCEFIGNEAPDTDAIDFDDVVDGLIANNRIYAFRGYNSDAIDAGEGCVNLRVVSNRIFNCTDKGVSVGQASEVHIVRNLIVDCDMGVGVKDSGSMAWVEQNTFARNNLGVAVFEKNAGSGGGAATVSGSIFHRMRDLPVFVDALSSLTVNYSLSDTLPLSGEGNLNDDPLFTDPGSYDFSLTTESPALDTGDPAYVLDPDGSRADMGAYYVFDSDDYPYLIPNIVVINEVLAHSHDIDPDWIELYNTSSVDLDMGGWFLSDDPGEPEKYRIAEGTVLPGGGYLVFYENTDFGAVSTNPGALIPFALSENGDTVHLFGPSDGLRPDYEETEAFGGSLRNVTKGRYFKESTRTYNFVTLESATPGWINSDPRVGPVVVSEIMYNPSNAVAEYVELVNISAAPVRLYDDEAGEPWRMTKGFNYSFPSVDPLTLQTGERVLLVRDAAAFAAEYTVPNSVQIFQWSSGALNNGGETLELSLPGDTNALGEIQFIRVDRVDYSDAEPWPLSPDGGGAALARIDERAYGNDVANWYAVDPSAGRTEYQQWAAESGLAAGEEGPEDDPDGDHLVNQVEYALGSSPLLPSASGEWALVPGPVASEIDFMIPAARPDVRYVVEATSDLRTEEWTDLDGTLEGGVLRGIDIGVGPSRYYRLRVILLNRYDQPGD